MASAVEICNIALGHLGIDRGIVSLTDTTSKEARLCKQFYDAAVEAVLRSHSWAFATRRIVLSLREETHPLYPYVYQYPANCLLALRIVDYVDTPINFEVELSEDGKSRVILCNREAAILQYIAEIHDANLFDACFIEALSYKLAHQLAQPLKGQPNLTQFLEQKYQMALSVAVGMDAREGYKEPNLPSPLLKSRE